MKITNTILSIPPYISTSWDKVVTIYVHEGDLHVHLKDGTKVVLHNLPADAVEKIFSFHELSLENQQQQLSTSENQTTPIRMTLGPLASMAQMLQHNPKQADLPPIPEDTVAKITQMAHTLSREEILAMDTPEPKCNCLFCQIGRVLRQTIDISEIEVLQEEKEEEEVVSDDELLFEEWNVSQISDKLYLVTNKLNLQEEYRVFLGDPVGCTCGKTGCEHIVAVLRY